jgi:hypothetical protein
MRGEPNFRMTAPVLARFLAKVVAGEGHCWIWIGWRSNRGYGYLRRADKNLRAHRVSYEHFVGPIPGGLQIDHLCRNRSCVNPTHLEVVTSRENTLRGDGPTARNARKTHCKHGHPLSGANLGKDRSWRRCLACSHENSRRAYYQRKREAEAA